MVALVSDDEAFVMTFGERPAMVRQWTPKSTLGWLTLDVTIRGSTPMFETLTRAVGNLSTARHVRRALLIITDGNATDDPAIYDEAKRPEVTRASPNDADVERSEPMSRPVWGAPELSPYRPPTIKAGWPLQAREALRRSEAVLYAVGIDSPSELRSGFGARPLNKALLSRFTDETDGYTEVVNSSSDLVPAVRRLADELKHQYLLGYASSHAHDGKYHKARIEARRAGCRVRSRAGFQADRGH